MVSWCHGSRLPETQWNDPQSPGRSLLQHREGLGTQVTYHTSSVRLTCHHKHNGYKCPPTKHVICLRTCSSMTSSHLTPLQYLFRRRLPQWGQSTGHPWSRPILNALYNYAITWPLIQVATPCGGLNKFNIQISYTLASNLDDYFHNFHCAL